MSHSKKRYALAISFLTLSLPQAVSAQSFLDAATSPGDVSFSGNSILPLQSNYPPLNSAVTLGTDIYTSNSGGPDTGAYSPTGIFQVDDINQAAKDSKPSFLKDLFLGGNPNRALHPTTVKVFDILGKAQKGLQTYKLGKSVYSAIKGKNPAGIIGGARNLLLLYGVIDPSAALSAASKVSTAQTIANSVGAANSKSTQIAKSTFKNPKTPYQWYLKGINNDAIASMAAQSGPDIVLSADGQQRLEAEQGFTEASVEALEAIISDAALSSVQVREYEAAGKTQAASSIEVAGKAQKRKSTQQAVKDLATQASIQANLAAIQNSTLAELNGNSLRQLGATTSVVQMQQVIADKTTTMQLMTAMNGRQLGNINNGVNRSHNYQVKRDLRETRKRQRSMQNFIIPVFPDSPTTANQASQTQAGAAN